MVAPNIYSITSIIGKTDVLAVPATATAITTCAANKVYKINSLIIANIDGALATDITVDIFRSSVAYKLASTIAVPADATLVVISRDMGIYLEENDVLRLTAGAVNRLQAFCSYDIIG